MVNNNNQKKFLDFLKSVFEKILFVLKGFNLFLRNWRIGYPHPNVNNLFINCVYLRLCTTLI